MGDAARIYVLPLQEALMRSASMLTLLVIAACSSATNPSAAPISERTVTVVGAGGATRMGTSATMNAGVATLEIPIDEVWQALPEAYEVLGVEIALLDRANGIVGNPGFRARRRLATTSISRYIDCGRTQGGPSADRYEVHFSVLTELVAESATRTIVSTVVDATARPINFSGDPVQCSSLGELENRILNFIRAAAQE